MLFLGPVHEVDDVKDEGDGLEGASHPRARNGIASKRNLTTLRSKAPLPNEHCAIEPEYGVSTITAASQVSSKCREEQSACASGDESLRDIDMPLQRGDQRHSEHAPRTERPARTTARAYCQPSWYA